MNKVKSEISQFFNQILSLEQEFCVFYKYDRPRKLFLSIEKIVLLLIGKSIKTKKIWQYAIYKTNQVYSMVYAKKILPSKDMINDFREFEKRLFELLPSSPDLNLIDAATIENIRKNFAIIIEDLEQGGPYALREKETLKI